MEIYGDITIKLIIGNNMKTTLLTFEEVKDTTSPITAFELFNSGQICSNVLHRLLAQIKENQS